MGWLWCANAWRCRPTVSLVVAHDEILPDRRDASGKANLVGADSLKEDSILHSCDLLDILLGAIEEHQN